MRQRSLTDLRAKNYDGSEEEWSAILKHVLVSKQESGVTDAVRQSLDVSCVVSGKDPKASLSISFRTQVEDITQRLGDIVLSQTQDDDVELFGWASQVISRRDELEAQLEVEKEASVKQKDTIDALKAQCDELVRAKAEHEEELFAKFAALLNEKKLRLRELNRLVSTAKVDKKALERYEETLPSVKSSDAKRGKKRAAEKSDDGSPSDESDGFEEPNKANLRMQKNQSDSEDDPQTSDNETETESEDGDRVEQPLTSQTEAGSAGPSTVPQQNQQSLPPPRELPFTRQAKPPSKAAAAPSPDGDEETASEDDEL